MKTYNWDWTQCFPSDSMIDLTLDQPEIGPVMSPIFINSYPSHNPSPPQILTKVNIRSNHRIAIAMPRGTFFRNASTFWVDLTAGLLILTMM